MGSLLLLDLATRAGRILNDEGFVHWTLDELIDWLNDSQRAVVLRRPDAGAINADFVCAVGAKQAIPAGAYRLIDITRNQLGSAVTLIPRAVLDAQRRDWYTLSPGEDCEHYTYDDRDPKTFYAYPPVIAGHLLEAVFSYPPADVVVITGAETIALDDVFAEAMLEYTLYRAMSKDSSKPGSQAAAMRHYEAFRAAIGENLQADTAVSPNG